MEYLKGKYQEAPVSRGLARSGNVYEVFASPAGTWTIIVVLPNGKACFVAEGTAYQEFRQLKGTSL